MTCFSLAALGAEVVKAAADNASSPERAFGGACGAFCVGFFGERFSPEKEEAQATSMAMTAAQAGLRYAIWSTLEDTRCWMPLDDPRMPALMGRYKVPHFDAKGASDHAFSDLGLPVTCLLASFCWDRHGPQERPGRQVGLRSSHGRPQAARHCGRGHRPPRLRHLPKPTVSSSAVRRRGR